MLLSPTQTECGRPQSGSALVVVIVVLVILATLGFVGLEVADLNIMSSANDRERKSAFFQADSGVNVGIVAVRETLRPDSSQATLKIEIDSLQKTQEWKDTAVDQCDGDSAQTPRWVGGDGICVRCDTGDGKAALIMENATQPLATYVRVGTLKKPTPVEGESDVMAQPTDGGSPTPVATMESEYLIRSRRYGERNSLAEVEAAWHEVH